MPSITDIAVCIRTWDFSETSQTVSLFAREQGVLRGLAKGSRREKGPFSGGIDVLTRGQVVAIIKPGRDLATITAWHLQEMYRAIRQSLAANRAGLYMADLIHHMLIDHDPHPNLFDAFAEALGQLDHPSEIDASLLRFQWTLLEGTGYQPMLDRDAQTGQPLPVDASILLFNPEAGGIVVADERPNAPAQPPLKSHQWRVRRQTVEQLHRLAARQPMNDDRESVQRANRLLAVYFRQILGAAPPSMRWAFPDLAL